MTEVIWHGRGGQGAFTAARLLGAAYVLKGEGSYALAFPRFGPERRGAPMRAFTKLDERPIGNRSEVAKADYCIFLDDTVFTDAAFAELKEGGKLLVNTKRTISDERVIAVDGTRIAAELRGLPITNTIMLGALVAASGVVPLELVAGAIRQTMPARHQAKNISAVLAGAKAVQP